MKSLGKFWLDHSGFQELLTKSYTDLQTPLGEEPCAMRTEA